MESLSAQRMEKGKTSKRLNSVDVSRKRWTPLEDAKLFHLVANEPALPNWKTISKGLPHRTSNSCRYRWEKLWRGKEISGPAFGPPPVFPMPFYPAVPPYGGLPVPWNMPWIPVPSGYNSTVRSGEEASEKNGGEKNLWIPKPLRIDDPDHEAAKMSIWETLGIKNEKCVAGNIIVNGGGGIFKAFQSKKKALEEASHAGPSRSLN